MESLAMTTRTFILLVSSAVWMTLNAQPLTAQVITSPYKFVEEGQTLSLFSSALFTGRGTADLGPGSGYVYGLRYGIRPARGPVELEAQAGLFSSHRTIFGLSNEQRIALVEADMSLLLLDAGMRFNFSGPRTFHNLKPFAIVGGGGLIQLQSDRPPEEEALSSDLRYRYGTRFAGHIGGGVEWFAVELWTVRLDLRNMLWQVEAPDGFLIADPALPTSEWTQNFFLSLGIGRRF